MKVFQIFVILQIHMMQFSRVKPLLAFTVFSNQ